MKSKLYTKITRLLVASLKKKLQLFMILLQRTLGCKNWVKDLRVIANLPFWTLLTQIQEHATPIFRGIIVILEYIYNLVMILHPTSSWLWKSGLVFEGHSQFTNSGPSAPNKKIGCHTHFLWNYCFIQIYLHSSHDFASNKPLLVKFGSVLHSYSQFTIFWS